MIKAVIFDLDGTLADTLSDLADSTNYALTACGFPTHDTEAYKYFVGNGIQRLTYKVIPEEHRNEETHKKVHAAFMAHYREHYIDKTAPYDGIVPLINSLKAMGIKLAVMTNKAQEMAEKVICKLFGDVFDYVYGKQENYPAKPDPTLTLKLISDLGVTPSECIFVGDSGVDMQTAVNSATLPVGALWGFRGKDELLENGAVHIISSPKEIEEMIRNDG